MGSLGIEVSDDVLLTAGQSRQEFVREVKFLLSAKLFEMGRLSSGKAAAAGQGTAGKPRRRTHEHRLP